MSKNLQLILTKEVLEKTYQDEGSLKAVARKFAVDSGTIKRYKEKLFSSDQHHLIWKITSLVCQERKYLE